MAWIDTVSYDASEGDLRREYDAAIRRAGRVFNVVRIMSLNPAHLRASMGLYLAIMHGPSGLSRAQREMLAVVVSKANNCHYWIEAHAADLRGEVANAGFIARFTNDWRSAGLPAPDAALMAYAEKLTAAPARVTADDIEALRRHGFGDEQISDAAQVIAYFNYINRIADGLGIDPEPDMPPRPAGE